MVLDVETIALLNKEDYDATYKNMKGTLGRAIRDGWTEKTDPDKYVFEDCGIASYLLELWRKYSIEPKKGFVDIGCGNGLLVHFLNQYKIPGFGFDVRERKIWAEFRAKGTDIRQFALDPTKINSSNELFGDSDFLIGNHSDELTPWIPILAARLQCNFFILPCCPYNFFSKFSKQMPAPHLRPIIGGLVEQYYAYIKYICMRLGFNVFIDNLRIPSRKKKCFIGIIPSGGLAGNLEDIILELLENAKQASNKDRFTPKPPKLEVRNCTKIPWEIRIDLAKRIVEFLININPEEKIGNWRCGGVERISKISEMVLNHSDREVLSNQDKGLQTFLRNFHQLFDVRQGNVSIRRWAEVNAEISLKKKPKFCTCWLKKIHPDGCLLTAEECTYVH